MHSFQEGGKDVNAHDPADDTDIYSRLAPLSRFSGGNSKIQKRGMALIALSMLSDYERDVEEDLQKGKYNPIAAGVWDYQGVKSMLLKTIDEHPCPEMDNYMIPALSPKSFWAN